MVVAPRLQSTGSVVVVHGLSCSTACGIFLDQELNLCLLHWQADSSPLSHQGNLILHIFKRFTFQSKVTHDYEFSMAAVTNYHKLSGLKDTDLFSHSSGDQKFQIGLAGLESRCVPSGG